MPTSDDPTSSTTPLPKEVSISLLKKGRWLTLLQAVVSFTRGLANQQMSKGIRVNAVCPGPVWTPLIPSTMDQSAQDQFTSPMGRPAQPSEIATCFVFLASSDSSMISGQSLHPNGGVIVNG